MKNKEAFIVIGVIIVALILVFTLGSGDKSKPKKSSSDTKEVNSILANAENESESVKETEKKEFNSINVSDLVDYYKEEDSKIVLIARPTCHYCQIAEPILHNIAYKYDYTRKNQDKLKSTIKYGDQPKNLMHNWYVGLDLIFVDRADFNYEEGYVKLYSAFAHLRQRLL